MYQFIERDEQGAINTQQSILNCLNHALYQETAPQVQAFSQEEHGEVLVFCIRFTTVAAAQDVMRRYETIGEQQDALILLKSGQHFLTLFNDVLQVEQLLTNPATPPQYRVNFLELFAKEVLSNHLFYGDYKEAMQVGFSPISFDKGHFKASLRARFLNNNNRVVHFDNFEHLILIAFNSTQKAKAVPLLKSLLSAVRQNFLRSSLPPEQVAHLQGLSHFAITELYVDIVTRKFFVIFVARQDHRVPQFEEIRHFRRLLSHALGEHFTVESSLKKGRFCLEIVPVNRIYFSQDAISVLQEFFTNHRADLCVAELKENLSKLTLLQCDAPCVPPYSFAVDDEFAENFTCTITGEVFESPIVVGDDGNSITRKEVEKLTDNPFTRAPIEPIRENELLSQLITYFKTHPLYPKPALLEGLEEAVLLPNGRTVSLNDIKTEVAQQNQILVTAIVPSTRFSLDGISYPFKEVWPNQAIRRIIASYQSVPQLNPDQRVIDNPDNVLASVAATVASLLSVPGSLSKEEAERCMYQEELPVYALWSTEPKGLRLGFKDKNYAQRLAKLMHSRGITLEQGDAEAPYKSYIYLKDITPEDRKALEKFLFDICHYNKAYAGFQAFFSGSDLRCTSQALVVGRKRSEPDAGPRGEVGAELSFFHAIFYETDELIAQKFDALPDRTKRGYQDPALSHGLLQGAASINQIANVVTLPQLMSHVLPAGPWGAPPMLPIAPLPLGGGQGVSGSGLVLGGTGLGGFGMGLGGSGLSLGLSLGSTPFPHLGSSSALGMGPGFGAQASAPLPLAQSAPGAGGGLTPSAAAMAAINAAVHPSMTVAGAASSPASPVQANGLFAPPSPPMPAAAPQQSQDDEVSSSSSTPNR